VRAIGPAVSCDLEIGMIPARLTRPTVGLMPTTPQTEDGETIDPSVSVPTATAQRLAETATADPELEPDGLRSRVLGQATAAAPAAGGARAAEVGPLAEVRLAQKDRAGLAEALDDEGVLERD
jgi:hypothetical protein